jgi:hypothetical protein
VLKGCSEWEDNMKTIDLGNGAEYRISDDGNKYWYLNGKLHRTDGPAIESEYWGNHWVVNGRPHRTDGPAVERPDGKEWYVNGKEYTEEEFEIVKQVLWAI